MVDPETSARTKRKERFFPVTCTVLKGSMYVDDVIVNVNSEKEAMQVYFDALEVFQQASMHLPKWNSKS